MPTAHTLTRLKGYVTLRTVPGGAFMPDASSIVANLQSLRIIGAAQRLYINMERDTNSARWEFSQTPSDPGLAMIPAETYPGRSQFSLTLQRVDLYTKNMLEAFGFNTVNIADQFKPIVMVVEQPVPEDSDGSPLVVNGDVFKRRTYVIPGCWFNKMQIEYDITESDLKHVQETEMIVQNVISQSP